MVLMAAAHEKDLADMVATSVTINDKPSAVRYPRGAGIGMELPENGTILEIGKGEIVQQGKNIAILSYGARFAEVQKAATLFRDQFGYDITVANAKFAKPLDNELIEDLAENHDVIITIEEGSRGGFGSFVLDYAQEQDLFEQCKFKTMTLPDIFIDHDTPGKMYAQAGLDASGIFQKIKSVL